MISSKSVDVSLVVSIPDRYDSDSSEVVARSVISDI